MNSRLFSDFSVRQQSFNQLREPTLCQASVAVVSPYRLAAQRVENDPWIGQVVKLDPPLRPRPKRFAAGVATSVLDKRKLAVAPDDRHRFICRVTPVTECSLDILFGPAVLGSVCDLLL